MERTVLVAVNATADGEDVVAAVVLVWPLELGQTATRGRREENRARPVKARAVEIQVVRKTMAMDSCIV
jgi:hypothetical protein